MESFTIDSVSVELNQLNRIFYFSQLLGMKLFLTNLVPEKVELIVVVDVVVTGDGS